ncbi:hypothetical protein BsWGS_23465 [Bradybaena similaris]
MHTSDRYQNLNIPKDSVQTRSLANVYFKKRRIPKEGHSMEHRQNQARRNQINHSPWYTDLSQATQLPYIGFDNSDKNKQRNSIESCTDIVAAERRFYGPWQIPNAARQTKLVDRLAAHKLPAPPDPQFASWVNHFQHFWNIGVHPRHTRKSSQKSSNTSANLPVDSPISESRSENNRGNLYMTSYHRLMRRQLEGLGKQQAKDLQDDGKIGGIDDSGQLSENSTNNKLYGIGDANLRRKGQGRGYRYGILVPGLDRRYLGLQVMDKQQLEKMVMRLTRMTSAYRAKFSPNPHVWIDTSPGAHMVIKRQNTTA